MLPALARRYLDLDGTLIDNRRAIEEAYRAAGVKDVQWHRPWPEWCTLAQHDRKTKLYPIFLKEVGQLTTFGRHVMYLGQPFFVLTGASHHAVLDVRRLWPDLAVLMTYECGLTPEMKAAYIERKRVPTIYVDDDVESRRIIRERTTTCHVLSPEEALPLWFWPQEPTLD